MDNRKVLDITDDVKWVGIFDPSLVTFDVVMETRYGTTYNSYFIDADKKTLIETAKDKYEDDYLEKIKSVVNPEEIEYIIMNHTEPDHSGSLKSLLKIAPNATVVGSKTAIRFLKSMINDDFKHLEIKEGDELDLGNKTIKFYSAMFLHWPDAMYSYLVEDKVLFSCDSFGCHFCDERMFDDEVDDFDNAFKYYYDVIMGPFSEHMLKAIDKVKQLDIDVIAPGHGPILRTHWKKYVEKTEEMANSAAHLKKTGLPKVFIPYVSAYGNTRKIAELIKKGLLSVADMNVVIMDIEHADMGDVQYEIDHSDALLIGTPTITQNTFLPIYTLFGHLNPVVNKGKVTAAFGSYGWSGEGVNIVQNILKSLKLKPFKDGLKVNFVPDEGEHNECFDFGEEIGKEIMKNFE